MGKIIAEWNGKVIASSDETVLIEGNHYFNMNDVDQSLLTASETTTVCSWKGTANYYNVVVDGEINKDAVWYYAEPKEAAIKIKDRVAFWKGVKVTEV